jgi:hypothetical protein
MTLTELIVALEAVPPTTEVVYSDGTIPERFYSWRGDYSQLTLSADGEEAITAGALLALAKAAVGATFEGYKGGDYVMHGDSPLYADDDGTSRGFALLGSYGGHGQPLTLMRVDIGDYV